MVFSDYEKIYILEIPKSKEDVSNPVLANWLKFLNAKTEEEFNMLATTSEPMGKAVKEVFRLSADEKARMLAGDREMAIMDYDSGMYCARKEGLMEGEAKGFAKGEANGLAKVFALLESGVPLAEAKKMLGL
jgi:predicted transposase/invertase (TIGR01784 family)